MHYLTESFIKFTCTLGLNQNIVCFPFPTRQFDLWVGGRKKYLIFSSIIGIADKIDHSYVMFLTNVDVHNTNEKQILKKIILHQMMQ
jgi:hypothetical protein